MSTPTPNAQRSPHEQGWTSSLPGAKLRRVLQYIQHNADKDLSLAALAAVVCSMFLTIGHFLGTVSFDVLASDSLSAAQRERLLERAGRRLVAVAQDERSQARNRELALARLLEETAERDGL